MRKQLSIILLALFLIIIGGFVPNTPFLWSTAKELYFGALFLGFTVYVLIGFKDTTN